jgi:hypothetical protein
VKYLDFFFLKIFHFLIFLKLDEEGAKWSAILYTSLYILAFIILFLCLVGLQFDNYINIFKHNSLAVTMIFSIICPILLSIRYYRFKNITTIEASYNKIDKSKRRLIVLLVNFTMVTLPILAFIFFRLLLKGRIIWW